MSISSKIRGLSEVLMFDNWIDLISRRIFFRATSLVVYRFKGCELIVDHNGADHTGIRPCLVSQMYRAFLPHLKLGRSIRVLDIGANAGGFSLMLFFEGFEVEKLVAVEMNPQTSARLRVNLYRNILPLPIVINAAISGEDGLVRIPHTEGSTGEAVRRAEDSESGFEIKCLTLNSLVESEFLDEDIDICKMDVEGAEFDVFGGSHYDRLRQCRHLIIEIHRDGNRDPLTVVDAIEGLGFEQLKVEEATEPNVYCFRRI